MSATLRAGGASLTFVIALLAYRPPAHADDPAPETAASEAAAAPERAATSPPSAAEPPPSPAELAEDVDALWQQQQQLARDNLADAATREQVKTLWPLRNFITVFVDVGAFAVGGDGSGIRSDVGHLYFPEYAGRIAGQWVFMGDPLSTAINSLGEPSDTASSRSLTTDTINSGGHPSFVVNTLGLAISKDVGHGFGVRGLAHVMPRPSETLFDVQLASVGYRPFDERSLVIEVGKIDSVLGIEYRTQDARNRLGVTPSLICRYTCGRPLGVRAQLDTKRYSVSATLTNGDNFQQLFERDVALQRHSLPTAAAHVQWHLPVEHDIELGASGAVGPQDGQPDNGLVQWHVGGDVRVSDPNGWNVAAEYVQGKQPGASENMIECAAAPCLSYKGAYAMVDHYATTRLTPYVRVDWRSAVHTQGSDFVYESHTARATLGGRFAVTSRIVGKLEYTYNRELGGIPQFSDDVLTTSIVVATD